MFTILDFKIKHKNKVMYECIFSEDEKGKRKEVLTTLVIGENGAGKSYLLKMISDFFRYLSSKSNPIPIKYDYVKVRYYLNGDLYCVEKDNTSFFVRKNNEAVDFSTLRLPVKNIVLSFMVNDKFSFSNNSDDIDNCYKYLGVRATSNATYTSTIQKKVLSSVLNILSNKDKIASLKRVFEFVDLNGTIDVVYKLKRKTLFTRGVNILKEKEKYFNERNYSFSRRSFDSYEFEMFDDLGVFINQLKHSRYTYDDTIRFSLNISSDESFFRDNIQFLDMMEKLGLISNPEIQFAKDDLFDFEYTSSGEKNFIFTMVNLISAIEGNSLILIDEPEISLHPRWQMKYINLLKSITSDFNSSHCLLASHSHFMVSDLAPESSTLISLSKSIDNDGLSRRSSLIPYDTYAWSVENILYEVFKLRGTRNSYFEQDLTILLKLISEKSNNYGKIKQLQEKLEQYVFNENDPVNIILSQSRKYLDEVANDQ